MNCASALRGPCAQSELDSARSEATGSTTSRDDLVRRTRALEAELARERTGASGLRADVARAAASISEWEAAVQDALAALRSRAPADDRRVLAALDALDAALREPLAAQGAGQVVAGRDGDAGRSRLATSGAGPLATSDLNGELDDESESARLAARLARLRDVWTGLWEVNRTLLSRVAVDALDATTSTADAVAQLRATRAALAEAQRGAGSALEWRARADQLESALAAEKTVNRRLLEDLERATLAARSARTAPASAASAASGGPSAAPFGSTRLGLATSLTPPPMSSSLVFGTLGDSATARSDGLVAHLQDQLRETEASRGSYAAELTRLRTQLRDAETAWSEASKQRGDAEAETLLLQSQLRQLLAERDEARSVLLRETRDAAERGALEVGRLRERLRRFRHHVRSRLDRIRAAVRGDQSSRPADWNPADGDASPPRRSTTATRLGAEWDDPPRSAARAGGVRSGSLASSAGSRGRADDGSDESRAAEDDGSLFAALDTISSLVQWFEEEGGRFSSEATGLAEELARRIEVLEGRLAQAEGAIGPALGAVRSLQSQLASRTGEAAALRERGDSLASHVEALEAALRDTERRRADGEQELGELRETNRLLTLELHEKIAALQAAAKVHRALESASDALRDHTGLGASSGFAGARSESSGVARATAIARSRASVAPPDPQDTWLQSVLDMVRRLIRVGRECVGRRAGYGACNGTSGHPSLRPCVRPRVRVCFFHLVRRRATASACWRARRLCFSARASACRARSPECEEIPRLPRASSASSPTMSLSPSDSTNWCVLALCPELNVVVLRSLFWLGVRFAVVLLAPLLRPPRAPHHSRHAREAMELFVGDGLCLGCADERRASLVRGAAAGPVRDERERELRCLVRCRSERSSDRGSSSFFIRGATERRGGRRGSLDRPTLVVLLVLPLPVREAPARVIRRTRSFPTRRARVRLDSIDVRLK